MLTGEFEFRRDWLGRMQLRVRDRYYHHHGHMTSIWDPADRPEANAVFLALHARFGMRYRFARTLRGRHYLQQLREAPVNSGFWRHSYGRASMSEALAVYAMMRGRFR